jgi:hypothetical protein
MDQATTIAQLFFQATVLKLPPIFARGCRFITFTLKRNAIKALLQLPTKSRSGGD